MGTPKPPRLSLRMTLGALSALIVLVVAGITLAITLVFATDALRAIGRAHTTALAHTARTRIEDFINLPYLQCRLLQNISKEAGMNLPVDDYRMMAMASSTAPLPPTAAPSHWHDKWTRPLRWNLMVSGYSWSFGMIMLADGSVAHVSHQPVAGTDGFIQQTATRTTPFVTETTSWNLTRYGSPVYLVNSTTPRSPTEVSVYQRYADVTESDLYIRLDLELRTSGATRPMPTLQIGFLAARSQNPDDIDAFSLPVIARLVNRTGQAIGIAAIGIDLSQITVFLKDTPTTPNTHSFVIDKDGFLLGSTHPIDFISFPTAGAQQTAAGCVSESLNLNANGPTVACRTRATSFPYPPLQEVARDDDFALTASEQHKKISVEGDSYFVVSTRTETELQFRLNLILILPEADILGDINTGRNTAIGVTIAVLIIAVFTSFVVSAVALSPLEQLAGRMTKAASFEDDDTTQDLSIMREIYSLQVAYYAMNEQLNRVKSFVPQSVLLKDVERGVEESAIIDEELGLHDDQPSPKMGEESGGGGSMMGGSTDNASTTNSSASHRSTMSYSVPLRIAGGTQLNLACSAVRHRISVLVINLLGFNAAVANLDAGAVTDYVAELVSTVCSIVAAHRGVMDSFHGDRFVLTFNALSPASAHTKLACLSAMRAAKELPKIGPQLAVTSAVCTGMAAVGNMGSTVKRFNHIGPVYSQAIALERACKMYEVGCLTQQSSFVDLESHFVLEYMDIAYLPGAPKPVVIAAVHGEINVLRKELEAAAALAAHNNKNKENNSATIHGGDTDSLWTTNSTTANDQATLASANVQNPGYAYSTLNRAFLALKDGQYETAKYLSGNHQLQTLGTNSSTPSSVTSSTLSSAFPPATVGDEEDDVNDEEEGPTPCAATNLQKLLSGVSTAFSSHERPASDWGLYYHSFAGGGAPHELRDAF